MFLFTENDIAVAEPLIFNIDTVNLTNGTVKPKRTDFISKITAITAGSLALSLLLSGAKNKHEKKHDVISNCTSS